MNSPLPSPCRSQSVPQSRDVWQHWTWIWWVVFVVSLLVPFASVIAGQSALPAGERGRIVALTIALLLWQGGGFAYILRRRDWRDHSWISAGLIAGQILLWYGLVRLDPAFYFVLAGLYSQIFLMLSPRWAVLATISLTLLALISGGAGALHWENPALWAAISGAAAGLLLYGWITAIIRQSLARKALIEQLADAQAALGQAERSAGASEERQRLAGDLHDTLAQGFVSVVLHLEAAEETLLHDPPLAQRHLQQAKSSARRSLAQARAVMQELRQPPAVLPLPQALQDTVQHWSGATGIPALAMVTGIPQPLQRDTEAALLLALQEALANVRKHAAATRVDITLSYMDDQVVLDVQDDGAGFDPVSDPAAGDGLLSGSYGLTAMRERVARLGGALVIESSPGEGATLAITLPKGDLDA